MKLEIVTPERIIFSDTISAVTAPGIEGQLGILPHHSHLVTMLRPGELKIRKGEEEVYIAIGGGFLEVRPDRVIILADVAERDDEIDAREAEKAILQAQQTLAAGHISKVDKTELEAALRLELARLQVVEKKKKKRASQMGNHSQQ